MESGEVSDEAVLDDVSVTAQLIYFCPPPLSGSFVYHIRAIELDDRISTPAPMSNSVRRRSAYAA